MDLPPLLPGHLTRRHKRFLAEVALDDGRTITAHCPNTGAMIGLCAPGTRVYVAEVSGAARKLDYRWALCEIEGGSGPILVGIDTARPNALVAEAIGRQGIPELAGYTALRREVPYAGHSRIDFLLTAPDRPPCYVEVKNVHLMRRPGLAEFPDCVTARGTRHLQDLVAEHRRGARCVMLYVIQMAAQAFDLAADLDPAYAAAFRAATDAGVEALAYDCYVGLDAIGLARRVAILTG